MKRLQTSAKRSSLIGAAFIMATSSIGPGFIMQTAAFTQTYQADFGFAIVLSLLVSIIAQLNVWRIICASSLRGQDIANRVIPCFGYAISALVALGGLAFNIGNIGGAAIGLSIITGWDISLCSCVSAIVSIWFLMDKRYSLDGVAKALGVVMVLLILYIAIQTKPPLELALQGMYIPQVAPWMATITLIGGTVGGYITFSGGHRLLDQGISGLDHVKEAQESALLGMAVDGLVRFLLFLAVLGVVHQGFVLQSDNPAGHAFFLGAGQIGYYIFGVIYFCASLTSIMGSAYTSITFLKSLIPPQRENMALIVFILLSLAILLVAGKPVTLMILAGAFNGLILPVTLGLMLWATKNRDIVGTYKHPKVLYYGGWVVVLITTYIGMISLGSLGKLW